MLNCFTTDAQHAVPIAVITRQKFPDWLAQQTDITKNWLRTTQFHVDTDNISLLPDAAGNISAVLCCVDNADNFWQVGHLPTVLPAGIYALTYSNSFCAIAWGLGAYQFTRYKKPMRTLAQLYLAPEHIEHVSNMTESIYLVRDWINTPTEDMGPTELAVVAKKLAKDYGANFSQIIGEDLLKQNYAAIYTVGKASDDAPRLLDLRWGNLNHPKVSLVGKGVCFDSGGLDIKNSTNMLLMKKDMAGGAHVLGLARMIMQAKLPICLRVLIPAVENVIAGNAYHPGDVIKSRKGLTIEVGNTDAEGRLVLADALTEAVSEKPELLIDISTLTGAARIALGTELPVVFSNHNPLVNEVIKLGEHVSDPLWRLPLFAPYRDYLHSQIADINNNSSEPYAGAITAALFLQTFIPADIPWLHFDMMAWNLRSRPGRPQGAEAMALRALFSYLSAQYG